ncbi:MAG: CHAP domain-containing protein [Breznakia sp.]
MKKQTFKMGMMLVLCFSIGTTIFYTQRNIQASEFEGNEAYWTQTCSLSQTSASMIKKCEEYRAYLYNKINENRETAANAQSKIDAMASNLIELGNAVYQYEQDLITKENEIAIKEAAIAEYDAGILAAEDAIKKEQVKIDARKKEIMERMVHIQQSINTNEYINFIMGSEDLIDFIQRSQSITTFTEANNTQIELLNKAIAKLNNQKEELVRLQETKKVEQAVLESEKASLVSLKTEADVAYQTLETQKNALSAEKIAANNAANGFASIMPPVPSPGGTTGGPVLGGEIYFYSSFYRSPFNIFSNVSLTGQCTWFVLGRAAEVNGTWVRNSMPTGHAQTWYTTAANNGLPVGKSPATNSIIIWGSGQFGHVAFVESYNANGTITISEGNVGAPGGGLGYGTSLETAIQYTRVSTLSYQSLVSQRGTPTGFIYY